jgi:hypothetical protein
MGAGEVSDMDEGDRDVERYREAANSALGQLEWLVSYFHRIRKPGIAASLDENRKTIAKRYRL